MIRLMGRCVSGVWTPPPAEDILQIPGPPGSSAAQVSARLAEARESIDTSGNDFMWISLDEATKPEILTVAEAFDLNHLQVEDAATPRQRAKVEVGEHNLFMLMKVLEWVDATSDIETGQIACFVGRGYAITVSHGRRVDVPAILDRLTSRPDLAATGPVSVTWAVADVVVDVYLAIASEIEANIEQIEDVVFSPRPQDATARIYRLNRENVEMRRAVRPLGLTAVRLARGDLPRVPPELVPFFRDIGDHVLRVNDLVDSFDSVLMTMLMASTARQDLMQNHDMRKIAAYAGMIAVPTAIAGIYGMNFDYMPELHWTFGYPAVLTLMAVLCLLLWRGFKKSGWL